MQCKNVDLQAIEFANISENKLFANDSETYRNMQISAWISTIGCCKLKWAAPWENVSSGISDQVWLKPAYAATEAS